MDVKLTDTPISIKDLSMETPKSGEFVFNPEQYLKGLTWTVIETRTRQEREMYNWAEFSYVVGPLAVVSPTRLEDLDLKPEEGVAIARDWGTLVQDLTADLDVERAINMGLALKFAFPSLNLYKDNSHLFWRLNRLWMDAFMPLGQAPIDAAKTGLLTIQTELLFPGHQDLAQTLDRLIDLPSALRRNNDFKGLSYVLAGMRLKGQAVKPTSAEWQQMIDSLPSEIHIEDRLNQLMCMKILAAKEVHNNDEGLQLEMPETSSLFADEEVVLPNTRKF